PFPSSLPARLMPASPAVWPAWPHHREVSWFFGAAVWLSALTRDSFDLRVADRLNSTCVFAHHGALCASVAWSQPPPRALIRPTLAASRRPRMPSAVRPLLRA